MRAIVAVAIVAALAAPASAQQQHMLGYREQEKEKTQTQKDAEKADREAYQRSLSAIPDQGPTDPWGRMRSTNEQPKSAAIKSTKARMKTGHPEAKPQ